MKISTKGRYGLRAMIDLAQCINCGHVPIKDIAKRQDVSESYLEQVFSTLKKSGLVNSIQGSHGGYILSESPYNISIAQILEILEGELSITENSQSLEKSDMQEFLNLHLWEKVDNVIQKIIDGTTLQDLTQSYEQNNIKSEMYYI